MNESQRQRDFLAALTSHAAGRAASDEAQLEALALHERGPRAARGLEAYRANAEALADRALAAVFSTVKTMVGTEDFMHLARAFWCSHPPVHGDMGEWGGEFPAWLAAHAALARWPYLGDCAALDLALHRNERAADAAFDAASLTLLESTDPSRLRMLLMPGTAVLSSAWPIASIHEAHQLEGDAAEQAFERVREALAASRAEQALVARRGWRGVVHRIDPVGARWALSLLAGADLAAALMEAGEGFDFAAWLATALRESWLEGVVERSD